MMSVLKPVDPRMIIFVSEDGTLETQGTLILSAYRVWNEGHLRGIRRAEGHFCTGKEYHGFYEQFQVSVQDRSLSARTGS